MESHLAILEKSDVYFTRGGVRLDFLKWWKTIYAEYQTDKDNHASEQMHNI